MSMCTPSFPLPDWGGRRCNPERLLQEEDLKWCCVPGMCWVGVQHTLSPKKRHLPLTGLGFLLSSRGLDASLLTVCQPAFWTSQHHPAQDPRARSKLPAHDHVTGATKKTGNCLMFYF